MRSVPQSSTSLLERLEAAGKTPTPPAVVVRILELTRNPDANVKAIADTIAMDPALTAKILRFVNSPLAGVSREVSSVPQAVALLGVRAVKMMALSFTIVSRNRQGDCPGYDHDRFVLHSLACGAAAKHLATLTRNIPPQEAFVAGLLSQLAWSALARGIPAEYAPILTACAQVPRKLPAMEQKVLGDTYPRLGGALLRSWGIPDGICSAIAQFRDPPATTEPPTLATILNLAEAAASCILPFKLEYGNDPTEFIVLAAASMNMGQQQCVESLNAILKEIESIQELFEIPGQLSPSADEVEDRIRECITELSLAMHLENKNLVQQQEELLRRATTDQLTGIGNRAAFDARLLLELERAARFCEPIGLLMIDVDKFKAFNDTYGHLAGDRVLQSVAKGLDDNIRKVDYAARYGGEEFAVIAPGTPRDGVLLLAERLRSTIESSRVGWEGKELKVTISVGVALLNEVADAASAAKDIIGAADQELYVAKCSGRNKVSFQHSARQPQSSNGL